VSISGRTVDSQHTTLGGYAEKDKPGFEGCHKE